MRRYFQSAQQAILVAKHEEEQKYVVSLLFAVCHTECWTACKTTFYLIPVHKPYDKVAVDVLQFPKTKRGNQYSVVCTDYLTKWPEAFAAQDQTILTIERLLVKEIISQHGVLNQLLS